VSPGEEGLPRALAALPALAGRRVRVTSLANLGWKQPQQLLVLAYALSKGASFDLVVNLDGFNELALPASENLPADVHPAYPRSWQLLAATAPSPEALLLAGEMALLEHQLTGWKKRAESPALAWSGLVRLLFLLYERDIQARLVGLEQTMALEVAPGEQVRRSGRLGPPVDYVGQDDVLPDLVAYWKRSSLLLQQFCASQGIAYLHVLQPNQYDVGSKPLSDEERKLAFQEGFGLVRTIPRGYPLLRQAGEELRAHGVAFRDASGVFRDHSETLYIDICCHYNRPGIDLVIADIADGVAELLARFPPGRPSVPAWRGFRVAELPTRDDD
jgi:hypothetical protein